MRAECVSRVRTQFVIRARVEFMSRSGLGKYLQSGPSLRLHILVNHPVGAAGPEARSPSLHVHSDWSGGVTSVVLWVVSLHPCF
jgi:hypothetical protein